MTHTHLTVGTLMATGCPSEVPLKMSEVPPQAKRTASTLKKTGGERVKIIDSCMPNKSLQKSDRQADKDKQTDRQTDKTERQADR